MAKASPPPSISPELIALQRVVAGRYSIVRELGRGGMGIVFLARDAALERPVAIKLLPPLLALETKHRTRFVREARTAAALSHPNIVPIHAVEEHDDLAFFVMPSSTARRWRVALHATARSDPPKRSGSRRKSPGRWRTRTATV